jgi:hypothetical protein
MNTQEATRYRFPGRQAQRLDFLPATSARA